MSAPNISVNDFAKWLSKAPTHQTAIKWGIGKDYQTFWDNSPGAEWLLNFFKEGSVDKKSSVRLALLVARRALSLIPFESLAKKTVDVAESWLFGDASTSECEQAGVKAIEFSASDSVDRASMVNAYAAVAYAALAAGSPDNSSSFTCVKDAIKHTNSAFFAVVNEVEEQFEPATAVAKYYVDVIAEKKVMQYKTKPYILEEIRQAFPKNMLNYYKVLEERISINDDSEPKSIKYMIYELSTTLDDIIMEASSSAMERYDEIFEEMADLVRQVLKRPAL